MSRRGARLPSTEREKRCFRVIDEGANLVEAEAQKSGNVGSCGVSRTKPYDLRWSAAQDTESLKVPVFRDEHQPKPLGVLPEGFIRRAAKSGRDRVGRRRIQIGEKTR